MTQQKKTRNVAKRCTDKETSIANKHLLSLGIREMQTENLHNMPIYTYQVGTCVKVWQHQVLSGLWNNESSIHHLWECC